MGEFSVPAGTMVHFRRRSMETDLPKDQVDSSLERDRCHPALMMWCGAVGQADLLVASMGNYWATSRENYMPGWHPVRGAGHDPGPGSHGGWHHIHECDEGE